MSPRRPIGIGAPPKAATRPRNTISASFISSAGGVPKDPAQAAIWLQRAAEQGHGRAQNNLSTFYFTGVGVQQDLAEAWKWLTLSADDLKGMGREIALQNRTKIEAKMSPAQLADAKRRVADWRR